MGSDREKIRESLAVDVSIHAPAWGATPTRSESDKGQRVSIHAPAWGATVFYADGIVLFHVSIHAPAWGATFDIGKAKMSAIRFNPRSRMGSDCRLQFV